MAVETAKIVIEGDTNGATVALKETARATDEVTTASKAAGAQLADLTRQTQVASKAQADAAAAINRMKVAQDEATMTARAFGAKSDEAAEAQKRLQRATEAAKAAEAAAKQELEQLKLGLAATGAAADKASPALARATKETEKLTAAAERNSNELKKAELTQAANARASGKGAEGFNLLGAAGGKLMAVLGPAALGGTLIAAGRWLGEAAERTLQYETALNNLPFALDGATRATGGLIGEQALLAAASSATSLKVTKTSQDFELLAAASVKLGAKLGQPADQLLNNLVTALGRGSTELLDNAGIVLKTAEAQERYAASIGKAVGQLTDEEKASAFRVEAFKAIVAAADATTVSVDSNAAAIVRLKNKAGGAWDSIERGAVNAAGAILNAATGPADELAKYVENAQAAAEITARWNDEADDAPITLTDMAVATVRLSDEWATLNRVMEATAPLWAKAKEDARALSAEEAKAADFAERQAKAYAKLLQEQEAHLDAQAMASVTYGPALPPKAEKKGKAKPEAWLTMDQAKHDVAVARIGEGRDMSDAIAGNAAFIESSNAAAAEAAAIEQSIEARQRSIEAITAEMEAREAAGLTQDDLLARRFDAERELLDYTRRTSNDKARIQEAETRFAKAQHDKRLRDLRATYAAEQKEQAKRQQHMQVMAGAVEGFGSAVVGAMEAEAEGSKGAIAKSLQAWLVGVRNQMTVKALVEVALGVASAASYNYPAAAQHFTAAGLATGAAAAAGIAGAAIGAAVPSGGGSSASSGAGPGAGSIPSSSSGSGSSGRDGNERQDVPVSWTDQRGKAIDMPRQTAAPTTNHTSVVNVHVTGLIAGDEKKLGAEINRLADKGRLNGKRN